MNFDKHLFRASAIGNIITKDGTLTVGAKTFLMDVFIGEVYGVQKEAYGKALEKGVACEQDGLKMLNDTLYPGRFVKKIADGKENDFVKGTPDTIMDGKVWDVKNAYTLFSFGKATLSHDHKWQILTYQFLHDLKEGGIFYCLNNMPDHMICEEEKSMFYQKRQWVSMEDPEYLEACNQLRAAHSYDAMPIHHRFKVFNVERTAETDQTIKDAVEQARKHLNKLYKEHESRLNENLSLMQQAKELEEK